MNTIQNYQLCNNQKIGFKANYLGKSKKILKTGSNYLDKQLVYHNPNDTAKFIRNVLLASFLALGLSFVLPKRCQEIKIDNKEFSSNLEKANSDLHKLFDAKK